MHRDQRQEQPPTHDIVSQIEALHSEHEALKERISELDSQRWLTPEEKVERKRCQKMKLVKKDQIRSLSKMVPV